MKTFRHFRHALALLLVSVLLAGCNALPGENLQVEELLRAPRLSGDYGAVQTALNDWLGESAQLKYPMQGELLSPFLLQDLDGDGQQDAAVLYTTAQSTNVCIAILQRDDTGAWQVRQSVEGLADTVENVRLAQLMIVWLDEERLIWKHVCEQISCRINHDIYSATLKMLHDIHIH